MTQSRSERGPRPFVFLAFFAVLLLTPCALVLDNITLAGNDYSRVIIAAIALAGLAQVLVFMMWRRVPRLARMMLGLCALANLWTLFDAGCRCLALVMRS